MSADHDGDDGDRADGWGKAADAILARLNQFEGSSEAFTASLQQLQREVDDIVADRGEQGDGEEEVEYTGTGHAETPGTTKKMASSASITALDP